MVSQLSQHENNLNTVQGKPHISVSPGASVLKPLALTDTKFTPTGEVGRWLMEALCLWKFATALLLVSWPNTQHRRQKKTDRPSLGCDVTLATGSGPAQVSSHSFHLLDRNKSGTCFKGDTYQVTWNKDRTSRMPAAQRTEVRKSWQALCLAFPPPGVSKCP